MSKNNVQIGEILLRDHFGDVVALVGTFLLKNGWTTLHGIGFKTQIPLGQVKFLSIFIVSRQTFRSNFVNLGQTSVAHFNTTQSY